MANANNKGADQPAHPCSLNSTFVVHFLDSIIPVLAISEILRLLLASEQAGLSLYLVENPKDRFSSDMAQQICFLEVTAQPGRRFYFASKSKNWRKKTP